MNPHKRSRGAGQRGAKEEQELWDLEATAPAPAAALHAGGFQTREWWSGQGPGQESHLPALSPSPRIPASGFLAGRRSTWETAHTGTVF